MPKNNEDGTTSTKLADTLEGLLMHDKIMIIMVKLVINRLRIHLHPNKIKILEDVTGNL